MPVVDNEDLQQYNDQQVDQIRKDSGVDDTISQLQKIGSWTSQEAQDTAGNTVKLRSQAQDTLDNLNNIKPLPPMQTPQRDNATADYPNRATGTDISPVSDQSPELAPTQQTPVAPSPQQTNPLQDIVGQAQDKLNQLGQAKDQLGSTISNVLPNNQPTQDAQQTTTTTSADQNIPQPINLHVDQGPSVSKDQVNSAVKGTPLEGFGNQLYDLGVKYNVDPAFALAIAKNESNYGSSPMQAQNHNIWDISNAAYGGQAVSGSRWGQYPDVPTAIEAFYKLITNEYYPKGQTTVGSVMWGPNNSQQHAYAPTSENAADYPQRIVSAMQGYGSGQPITAGAADQTGIRSPAQRESQFNLGLSTADAYAFCGPDAAIAFAKSYGRNPTVEEAKQLAQSFGWTPQQGMAGIQSEQELLNAMDVKTKLVHGQPDWNEVAQDATNGNPVILDTPGHYFYIDAVTKDASGNQVFHVGTSGTDLKGGSEWMNVQQLNTTSMGRVRGALFADHPTANGPSVAETANQPNLIQRGQQAVGGSLDDLRNSAMDKINQLGKTGTDALMQGNTGNLVNEFTKYSGVGGQPDLSQMKPQDQYVYGRSTASTLPGATSLGGAEGTLVKGGEEAADIGGGLASEALGEAGNALQPAEQEAGQAVSGIENTIGTAGQTVASSVSNIFGGLPNPTNLTGENFKSAFGVQDSSQPTNVSLKNVPNFKAEGPQQLAPVPTSPTGDGQAAGVTAGNTIAKIAAGQQLTTQEQLWDFPQQLAHAVDPLRDVPVIGPTIDQLLNVQTYVGVGGVKSLLSVTGAIATSAIATQVADHFVSQDDPNRALKLGVIGIVGMLAGGKGASLVEARTSMATVARAMDNPAVVDQAKQVLGDTGNKGLEQPQATKPIPFTLQNYDPTLVRTIQNLDHGLYTPDEIVDAVKNGGFNDSEQTIRNIIKLNRNEPPNIDVNLGTDEELPNTLNEQTDIKQPQKIATSFSGKNLKIGLAADFIRQYIRSQYSGAVDKVAVKEALQNSVDASREIPGATTNVKINNADKTISVVDQGTGMLPGTLEKEFVNIGDSFKPQAGASGGKGTAAKAAILGNADDVWVRSVARDPGTGQLIDSLIHGSSDGFINGTVEPHSAVYGKLPTELFQGAPDEIKNWDQYHPNPEVLPELQKEGWVHPDSKVTGTAIWLRPLSDAPTSPSQTLSWSNQFLRMNRVPDQNIHINIDGHDLDPTQEYYSDNGEVKHYTHSPDTEPSEYLTTLKAPYADINIYKSPGTFENNGVSVRLLNHGQYQADQYVSLNQNAKLPYSVVADVIPRVDAKSPQDPWMPNRSGLTDINSKAIDDFIKNDLAATAIKSENDRLANTLWHAPVIKQANGLRFVDDTGQVPEDTTKGITESPVYSRLTTALQELHGSLADELVGKQIGEQNVTNSEFMGIAHSTENEGAWLGLSIPQHIIQHSADGILIDPWKIWQETSRQVTSTGLSPGEVQSKLVDTFTDNLVGTMIHEVLHSGPVGGHGEAFSGALTRAIAVMGSRNLMNIIGDTRDEVAFILRSLKGGETLNNDTEELSQYSGSTLGKYGTGARASDEHITDNGETSTTGQQPTSGSGLQADGTATRDQPRQQWHNASDDDQLIRLPNDNLQPLPKPVAQPANDTVTGFINMARQRNVPEYKIGTALSNMGMSDDEIKQALEAKPSEGSQVTTTRNTLLNNQYVDKEGNRWARPPTGVSEGNGWSGSNATVYPQGGSVDETGKVVERSAAASPDEPTAEQPRQPRTIIKTTNAVVHELSFIESEMPEGYVPQNIKDNIADASEFKDGELHLTPDALEYLQRELPNGYIDRVEALQEDATGVEKAQLTRLLKGLNGLYTDVNNALKEQTGTAGEKLSTPPGYDRYFHGTRAAYDSVDPTNFRSGLTGKGLYITSLPEKTDLYTGTSLNPTKGHLTKNPEGANVRPIDVPQDMKWATSNQWDKLVRSGLGRDGATEELAKQGYDGVKDINSHNAVVFGQSTNKLRNAISGGQGGAAELHFAATLGGSAAGGLAGYNSDPNASPQEKALRTAGGIILGGLAGYTAAKYAPQISTLANKLAQPAANWAPDIQKAVTDYDGEIRSQLDPANIKDAFKKVSGFEGPNNQDDVNHLRQFISNEAQEHFLDNIKDSSGVKPLRVPAIATPKAESQQITTGPNAIRKLSSQENAQTFNTPNQWKDVPQPGPGWVKGSGMTDAPPTIQLQLANNWVSPDAQEAIRAMLGNSVVHSPNAAYNTPIVGGIARGVNEAKRVVLNTPFHGLQMELQMGRLDLSAGRPQDILGNWAQSTWNAINPLAYKDYLNNQTVKDLASRAAKAGVTLSSIEPGASGIKGMAIRGAIGAATYGGETYATETSQGVPQDQVIKDSIIHGIVGGVLTGPVGSKVGEAIFDRQIPTLKLQAFDLLTNKVGMKDSDAAELINSTYGGQNLVRIARPAMVQDILRAATFAPDWWEGIFRNIGRTPQGMLDIVQGHGTTTAAMSAKMTAIGAASAVIGLEGMQMLLTGHTTDQNEKLTGDPASQFKLVVPHSMISRLPGANSGDPNQYDTFDILGYWRPVLETADQAVHGHPLEAGTSFAASRASTAVDLGMAYATNKDYRGQPITPPNSDDLTKLGAAAGYAANELQPGGAQQSVKAYETGGPLLAGENYLTGFRTTTTSPKQQQTKEYFNQQPVMQQQVVDWLEKQTDYKNATPAEQLRMKNSAIQASNAQVRQNVGEGPANYGQPQRYIGISDPKQEVAITSAKAKVAAFNRDPKNAAKPTPQERQLAAKAETAQYKQWVKQRTGSEDIISNALSQALSQNSFKAP